jgi:hypothetical protein
MYLSLYLYLSNSLSIFILDLIGCVHTEVKLRGVYLSIYLYLSLFISQSIGIRLLCLSISDNEGTLDNKLLLAFETANGFGILIEKLINPNNPDHCVDDSIINSILSFIFWKLLPKPYGCDSNITNTTTSSTTHDSNILLKKSESTSNEFNPILNYNTDKNIDTIDTNFDSSFNAIDCENTNNEGNIFKNFNFK